MDELEISKIFGAGCAALLAFVGFGQLGSAVVSVDQLDEAAYVIDIPDADTGEETEVVERMPIGQLMALANIDDGPKVFKKCSACHKVEEGSANGVGPMLYSIVGRDIAAMDGYSYSGALEAIDGQWDFAALDGFLEAPKKWAPGTKMGFAGLSKPEDRASVIAWLNEQSASPLPMPAVEEEAAEAPAQEEETAKVEAADATVYEGDKEVEVSAEDVDTATVEVLETDDADVSAVKVVPAEEPAVAEQETKMAAVEPAAVEEKAAEETVTEETVAEVKAEEAPKAEEPQEVEVAAAEVEEPTKAEEPAAVEAPAEPAKAAEVAVAAAASGFMALADIDKGAKVFRKCKACHKVEAGKNGVGPSLHGVVGRDIGAVDGFKYSDALMEKGGKWDVEALNGFLLKPKDWAPGTKMAFGGLRKEVDRASVIAWLNQQSDNPLPLE